MKHNLYRGDVVKGGVISVAQNREIIMGVAVVTKGLTHDKRGEFDEDSLNKVVELGNNKVKSFPFSFSSPSARFSGTRHVMK